MEMSLDVVPTGVSTATVVLTQDQVDALRGSPGRGRVPIAITYDGRTYRTSVAVYRGQWMLVVNEEMRAGGLVPGSVHVADVRRDDDPREVEVPEVLAGALDEAGLRAAFDALSFTRRKEYARLVAEAKQEDTRRRRVSRVLDELAG